MSFHTPAHHATTAAQIAIAPQRREVLSETTYHSDLGRSKPATTHTLTADEHFRCFGALHSTDVWTEDGWLVTAVQEDGVIHHLRKGCLVRRVRIDPSELLHCNPTPESRKWFFDGRDASTKNKCSACGGDGWSSNYRGTCASCAGTGKEKDIYVGRSKNLWEQMSDATRFGVAQLLGFTIDFNHDGKSSVPDRVWLGFKLTMEDIPPLPGNFTIGDAERAYLMHRLNNR